MKTRLTIKKQYQECIKIQKVNSKNIKKIMKIKILTKYSKNNRKYEILKKSKVCKRNVF